MAITLSSLGLEGQSPLSLEDDGRGHGRLRDSSLRKGGRWPWPGGRREVTMGITLSSLGLEGQSPSSLEDDGRGHGHLHDSTEERRKAPMAAPWKRKSRPPLL